MCTLSFLPADGGCHLLMNRDEQRSRPGANPPQQHACGRLSALYPSEPSGGTWIGVNCSGLTFALINWYSRQQLQGKAAFSRGDIIPKLLSTKSLVDAETLLQELPLQRLNPFRLITVSTMDQSIHEFRSDAVSLVKVSFPWERQHWFSSAFDEPRAMRERAISFQNSTGHSTTDPLTQLRYDHRSHAPEKGPFSICMHREDACTVSFTEITIKAQTATISYYSGSPCDLGKLPTNLSLALNL